MSKNRLSAGTVYVSDTAIPVDLIRIKKLPLSGLSGVEQAVWSDMPAKIAIHDVILDCQVAEATGGTKTLDVGTNSTGGSNDPNGFAAALNVASTGLLRPAGTYTATTEGFSYVSANTRGALLANVATGTTALSGHYQEKPALLVSAEELTVTAGSTDWAEFSGVLSVFFSQIT